MLAVLVTTDGGFDVPKYTSYEVAPLAADQLSVGAVDTPVVPLAGAVRTGVAGGFPAVVNEKTEEAVDPLLFLATIFQ